jgi:hypothetical protein
MDARVKPGPDDGRYAQSSRGGVFSGIGIHIASTVATALALASPDLRRNTDELA